MKKPLNAAFFRRPTLVVARALLGKWLVRRVGKEELAGMVTEVEAYDGFEDKASHASRGLTPRNAPMFGPPAHWYVYFTYGMHWMLNAVTGAKGYPAAVLIRGLDVVSGPARLTKAFRVGKAQNGKALSRKTGLWIEDRGTRVPNARIQRSPRVGVDYAGAWAKKPYRFRLLP